MIQWIEEPKSVGVGQTIFRPPARIRPFVPQREAIQQWVLHAHPGRPYGRHPPLNPGTSMPGAHNTSVVFRSTAAVAFQYLQKWVQVYQMSGGCYTVMLHAWPSQRTVQSYVVGCRYRSIRWLRGPDGKPGDLGQPADCFKNSEFVECYNFAKAQSNNICATSETNPATGQTIWGPGYPSQQECRQKELARAINDLNCMAVCGECGFNTNGKPCNSVDSIKKVQCYLGLQPTGTWDAASAAALAASGETYKSIADGCTGPDPFLPGPLPPPPEPPPPAATAKKSGSPWGVILLIGAALTAVALNQ